MVGPRALTEPKKLLKSLMFTVAPEGRNPLSMKLLDGFLGHTIIKTTYDISLDFQDSLLPLGFLYQRLEPLR